MISAGVVAAHPEVPHAPAPAAVAAARVNLEALSIQDLGTAIQQIVSGQFLAHLPSDLAQGVAAIDGQIYGYITVGGTQIERLVSQLFLPYDATTTIRAVQAGLQSYVENAGVPPTSFLSSNITFAQLIKLTIQMVTQPFTAIGGAIRAFVATLTGASTAASASSVAATDVPKAQAKLVNVASPTAATSSATTTATSQRPTKKGAVVSATGDSTKALATATSDTKVDKVSKRTPSGTDGTSGAGKTSKQASGKSGNHTHQSSSHHGGK